MFEFVLLLLVVTGFCIAYLRIGRESGRRGVFDMFGASLPWSPWSPGPHDPCGGTPFADLSVSLCNSLIDPMRARAHDRKIVAHGKSFVVVASPRDALTISGEREFFEDDVNELINAKRRGGKLQIDVPIDIVHVITDEGTRDGEPRLMTTASARRRQLELEEDSKRRKIKAERTEFAANTLRSTPVLRPSGWPPGSAGPGRGAATATATKVEATIAGTLVPDTKGLQEITVLAVGQKLGRSPDMGAGMIDVQSVSWNHAAIVPTETGWELRDTQSRHGTCVNGRPIEKHVLVDGDVIDFSNHARFTWRAHSSPYTPTEG